MVREEEAWTAALKGFTLRNAGRPSILEVDELEVGAQREATLMDLKGASFDPHGSRVDLMLTNPTGEHLTHTIANVTRIDILVSDGIVEDVLRVEHPEGQTLLQIVATTSGRSD